ncbi:hypothetical protein ARC63_03895 [Stenotrophomonas geniculata ATCC 19374 = JCM 13324]|nr:hypothetical protein ARC63_03895 [Stenotrophomonas geniculata ATCC 19374 = JCM 13324]CAH0066461.1 conserved protein of unknown function [Stenotrophomonas maltophilia]HCL45545.1 DUF2247 domain-containing protein [Pseudomonas sp.]
MRTYDCIQPYGPWSQTEVAWALGRHLIDFEVAKHCASEQKGLEEKFNLNSLIERLEGAFPDERNSVAAQLAAFDKNSNEDEIFRRWLVAFLADAYAKRDEIADPLGEVERIYADFDYPESLESFVRYMPASDGYDPAAHSHEQNVARLFENWKRYLDSAK